MTLLLPGSPQRDRGKQTLCLLNEMSYKCPCCRRGMAWHSEQGKLAVRALLSHPEQVTHLSETASSLENGVTWLTSRVAASRGGVPPSASARPNCGRGGEDTEVRLWDCPPGLGPRAALATGPVLGAPATEVPGCKRDWPLKDCFWSFSCQGDVTSFGAKH